MNLGWGRHKHSVHNRPLPKLFTTELWGLRVAKLDSSSVINSDTVWNRLSVSWHRAHRRCSVIFGINLFLLFTLSILVPEHGKRVVMAALTKADKLQRVGCAWACVCMRVCVWGGRLAWERGPNPLCSVALLSTASFKQKLLRLWN